MRTIKHLCILAAGIVAGITLVISCGDDAPRPADAATCDCAAAEPPISKDRVVQHEQPSQVGPTSQVTAAVGCDRDTEVVLGGGCAADIGASPDLVLQQSIATDLGWTCVWKNPTNLPINVRAQVRCLKLAR